MINTRPSSIHPATSVRTSLGEFKSGSMPKDRANILRLRRDLSLFQIIGNYLIVYSVIFLLPDFPPYLSQETVIANLLRDA